MNAVIAEPPAPMPEHAERRPVPAGSGNGLLAALAALAALVTLGLLAAGGDTGVAGLIFLVLGPGTLVALALTPRGDAIRGRAARATEVIAAGIVVLMLVGPAMLWLDLWSPRVATAILAGLTLAAVARPLWRARADARALPRAVARAWPSAGGGWRRAVTPLAAVVAAVLWLVALPSIDPQQPAVGGLLVGASPLLAIALGLTVVTFLAAVRQGAWAGAVMALVVAGLILRATTPLVSEQPMFDWTFKHVSVVEYIVAHGHLAGDVDLYQSWPGFFAASAWVTDVTGIDPVTQAHWFTLVLTAVTALAVYALARQAVGASRWAGLVAAFLLLTWNWFGQDYFAPQAVGFLLALVVIRLALARDRRAGLLAVLVFAGIVFVHQLTPFWVLCVLGALALGRKTPWWTTLACAAIALAYVGAHFDVVQDYGIFSGANVIANAQTSGGDFASAAKRLDADLSRLAFALIWLATAAVLWRRWRGGRDWYVGAVLAFAPFALLLAQRYGGEGALRVALYTLAGCPIILASPLVRLLRETPRRAIVAAVVATATVAATAQAYFGPWFVYQVSDTEIRVARRLLDEIPTPAYLAPAIPAWPDRASPSYVRWVENAEAQFDAQGVDLRQVGATFRTEREVAEFEDSLRKRAPWPTFLIFSPRMETTNAYRSFYAPDGLGRLHARLEHRPGWTTALRDGGVTVLRYVPPEARGEPAARWVAR